MKKFWKVLKEAICLLLLAMCLGAVVLISTTAGIATYVYFDERGLWEEQIYPDFDKELEESYENEE